MKNIGRRIKSRSLLVLFVTAFIDLLGFGLVIPIFPQLVTPGSPDCILPAGWTMAQGYILLGWISAIYPLIQFISTPILGQISDRYGRKPVLAFSIFGTVVGYVLFAIGLMTKNIPLLFASRILDGFTGGNISVAQAAVADISTEKDRAKNYGLIGVAFSLGIIMGPLIGGKLADPNNISWFSAVTPFWFAAGVATLNLLMVILLLPETLKVKISKRLDISRPFHNIAMAFSRPGLRSIMPMNFLFTAGFTFFTTFFGLTLLNKFGLTANGIGNYFAYVGICVAVVQGVLLGFFAKKFKDYQVLRFSLFIAAISLLGYALVPDGQYKWILLITPVLALGYGLTAAFSTSIVSRVTPPELQGEAMGINASVMALANSIPSIISGYVASINSNLPTIVACALMILAGMSFWILFRPGVSDKHGLDAPSKVAVATEH